MSRLPAKLDLSHGPQAARAGKIRAVSLSLSRVLVSGGRTPRTTALSGKRNDSSRCNRTSGVQLQGGQAIRHHDRGLGHRRDAGRRADRRAAGLPGAELRPAVAQLRPPAPAAHQRRDLRLRRFGAVRQLALRGAAHLPGTADLRRARELRVLGLAAGDRAGRGDAAARHDLVQGVRRARVADRHPDHRGVGRLRDPLLRHDHEAQDVAHLRGELVLRRLHHHDRRAAHRQQRGGAGQPDQVLLGLSRHHRRDGAVVVRPQRGGLLPDRRLPRHHVLLRAEAGRAPGLLLSPLDRALLGPDRDLHVGRPAPPALHRAARLGAEPRHGDVADPAGAELGRHDQRHDDPLGRVAQTALGSRRCASWSCRCPSTACRPSKAR